MQEIYEDDRELNLDWIKNMSEEEKLKNLQLYEKISEYEAKLLGKREKPDALGIFKL